MGVERVEDPSRVQGSALPESRGRASGRFKGSVLGSPYSTVTDFARLRGLSTSQPRLTAM